MNGQTLQALRGFLFFSVPEAARIIAQVQERTWRYWEAGRGNIPADVEQKIKSLIAFRQLLTERISVQIQFLESMHGSREDVRLTYYENLDDWMTQEGAEPICWRPHCAAMAHAASLGARLITFDPVAYKQWLGGRTDDNAARGEWAALQKV